MSTIPISEDPKAPSEQVVESNASTGTIGIGGSRSIPPRSVTIYCLTTVTEANKDAYRTAMTAVDKQDLYWIQPDFEACNTDYKDSTQDLYRAWQERGEKESTHHFAFFIDRESLADKCLIIAEPDAYTMLFSESASKWVHTTLNSYLDRNALAYPRAYDRSGESGVNEWYMEALHDDILGKRGVTYGRIPASAFRSVWANLDIGNMGLSELVEYHGGTVEMAENHTWNGDDCMGKLVGMMRESETADATT